MGKFDNEVVAVAAEHVSEITEKALENGGFAAFDRPDEYEALLAQCVTRQRGPLEEDPSFKQLIPYLVLLHEDKIFYYVRPGAISEQRLANKVSIGVGGHVELEDVAHADETIMTAMLREAREEVGEQVHIADVQPLGFIYVETSEVDRAHLGILFLGKLASSELDVEADEVGEHGFATAEQLVAMEQTGEYTLENWTKIALSAVKQHASN